MLTVPCALCCISRGPSIVEGGWRIEEDHSRQQEQVQKQDEVTCLKKTAWFGWAWKESENGGR